MKQFLKMKAIKIFLFALLLFAAGATNAQVGIGIATPAASAQLDVSSTNKGFLPPRMTQAQRSAIVNPAPGLMIWCADCGLKGEIQVHNGTTWTKTSGREGKNYYVKAKGDDTKDGLTIDKAWKTLAAVNNHMPSIKPGDSILFERGSYFYGQIKIESSGTDANPIVFGAYGTGDKPVFIGAKQINDPSIEGFHPWIRTSTNHVYEKEDGTFDEDVANLIFTKDGMPGIFVGHKIMTEAGTLSSQGDFWYDFKTHKLTLYSESDPQTFYKSIESVRSMNAIEFPKDDRYIVFENLNFKYYGYCVVEVKGSNCSYRNLDISYIGGGNNNPQKTINGIKYNGRDYYNDKEPYQQWGNGLQMWAGVHDVTITGCTIDNVYDAGISPQGTTNTPYSVYNLYMRNNVISNCVYSFEFFERGDIDYNKTPPVRDYYPNINTHDIYFENNTCINAGGGWGEIQRPNKWSTHVRIEGMDGTKSNIFIRNNIFYGAKEWLYWFVFNYAGDISNIVSDYNDFYQNASEPFAVTTYPSFTSSSLSSWKTKISKEANSVNENPLFINYPTDLHLRAGSPLIGKGIDVGYGKDIGAFPYKGN